MLLVIFYIGILVIVLIILIIQHRITLGFTFNMDNLVCSVFTTIYFFGTSRKIDIYPRIEKIAKNKKETKKKKVRKKRDLNQLKISFHVLNKLFSKSLIIKEFKLYVKEGTGDACYTAILYGLVWNLAGLIPTVIFTKYNVKNRDIKIETDFKEKVWKVNFDCIFSLKIVNIILMCIEILKYYLKNRKGGYADVRTSNRRSNDYSHAKY